MNSPELWNPITSDISESDAAKGSAVALGYIGITLAVALVYLVIRLYRYKQYSKGITSTDPSGASSPLKWKLLGSGYSFLGVIFGTVLISSILAVGVPLALSQTGGNFDKDFASLQQFVDTNYGVKLSDESAESLFRTYGPNDQYSTIVIEQKSVDVRLDDIQTADGQTGYLLVDTDGQPLPQKVR
jgi:hypothetical protein